MCLGIVLCKPTAINFHVKQLKTAATKSFLKNGCREPCLLPKRGLWAGSSLGLKLHLSFLLSFRRVRTVMALSRKGRRPRFRPAELLGAPRLGGGWTERQETTLASRPLEPRKGRRPGRRLP